jgi:hypothetical protein
MSKSLLETFEQLDPHLKQSLSEIDSPLLLAFAALEIAETEAGVQRLTVEHMVACLEAAGIAIKHISISKALARAGNKVTSSKDKSSDEVSYKLMIRGRKEIEEIVRTASISVVRIEGGRPHTARQHLGELLAAFTGLVRIADPYFGMRTLETLDHLSTNTQVQFLTSKTNESMLKVQGAFRDFARERKNVDFRLLPPPHDMHDRYVIADNALLIVGHGLKDIGGKESFVIRLDRSVASDLLDDLTTSFDGKWSKANPL